MSTLADAEARRDIVEALDENLFIEAGAGTGKTHELVQRVVNLVAHGTDPRRLAVITFTEAAAAELRERVREQLAAEVRSSADAARRDACTAALAVLDDAAIGTLHAFAQRILTEFAVDAGLPPGFEVLDEIEAGVAFSERWARWCDRMYADDSLADAITVAQVLGTSTWHLQRVARELGASWDRTCGWEPKAVPVPEFDPTPVLTTIDAAVALSEECRFDEDPLLLHLEDVADVAERVRAALDPLEALELLAAARLGGGNKGRKDNWKCAKTDVLERLGNAEAARVNAIQRVQGPTMQTLIAEVAHFVRHSVEQRRREGRVEFHDLLVFAVDVLRSSHDVRSRLHDRYEHLLLDEFQDTDPIQIELAVLIATADPDVGNRAWEECRVEPGRLFVVGDPKQSIYRFRRADITLYRKVRELLGTRDGGLRSLTTNFRSRPSILEFVNDVCAPLMTGENPLQAPYDALTADRALCSGTPDPVRTFGTITPKGTDLHRLRRAEARELAAIIRRVRDERWQVRDRGAGGDATRDARYEDIAILLPTRATLQYLEEALDEVDVPTRIESQSLVFATTEVQELLQVLQAIDDPIDDVAIVATLRSPGFACSDNDLVEFATAGGRWDYRIDPPPELSEDHLVVDGLRALRALHERRWWDGVSELVERVIRERRLLELAVERRRPRDTWRRLRFIADAARVYADRGGTSVRGFVSWAREQADEEARGVEVIVPEPDDDAVRVLTVHGAKGLEFPIVVLTGLGMNERVRTGPVLFGPDGPELRVGPQDARFITPRYDELWNLEKEAWQAEQHRLLYVALTRAEDHLVVSMHRRVGDNCLANCLADAAASRPELTGSAAAADPRPASPEGARSRVEREEWIAAREERIESTRRAATIAATALAKELAPVDDPRLDKAEVDATDAPPWRRGRAGTAIGRAVHAVLQTVDLHTGDGLAATARAQALAEGIPAREDDIRSLAESVIASPVVQHAVHEGIRYSREVPVAVAVNDVLVEGFIDLLVDTRDGFVVVDYKTDPAPSDAELDTALVRYTPQGAAYALALEEALGRAVSRCVFVFARSGGAVEREITDLDTAVASVREHVRTLVRV